MTSRGRPLPKNCPAMTSTMPLLSLESAAMLCRVDPRGRSGLLFHVWGQKILCPSASRATGKPRDLTGDLPPLKGLRRRSAGDGWTGRRPIRVGESCGTSDCGEGQE